MFSKINTYGLCGMRAFPVTVETDITKGIPYFDVVGMCSESVKEAKKRVKAAIVNQGLSFPKGKITQNLSPADIRKQGANFDLALAIGILAESYNFNKYIFEHVGIIGELSLNGEVLPVKGAIQSIVEGKRNGILTFIVPAGNFDELRDGPRANILPVNNLSDAVKWCTRETFELLDSAIQVSPGFMGDEKITDKFEFDFDDVYGQESVKRALLIAAAGNHNIIMSGSPGSGKSMMAKCLQGILPPLSYEEYFETLKIYSSCGLQDEVIRNRNRPFRTVHQGVTKAALLGGGKPLSIGELSLAHNGVLFMDELAETPRYVIDSLRIPLEEKQVYVINCGVREVFPSKFMFVGAMNPCECGNFYEPGRCICSQAQVALYSKKLSNPFLDRIDIKVPVRSVPQNKIGIKSGIKSNGLRNLVIDAREKQRKRYEEYGTVLCNGDVVNIQNYGCFDIKSSGKKLLELSAKTMCFSVRSYGKIIKVARTIADLSGSESILDEHLLESIQLCQIGGTQEGAK